MFNAIQSLLFGSEAPKEDVVENWIVVGDSDEEVSRLTQLESESVQGSSGASTQPSSSGTPTHMPDDACGDEAWSLMPPPCFTARDANDGPMRVSSLENLLLEHPSMSVYERRRGRGGEDEARQEEDGDNRVAPARPAPAPRPAALQDTTTPERWVTRATTRRVQAASTGALTRGMLKRNNLTQHLKSTRPRKYCQARRCGSAQQRPVARQ